MLQLVEMGFVPVTTIPNPKFPQFDCWVFAATPQFEEAFAQVVGGMNNDK
jgi:hypothetical protein